MSLPQYHLSNGSNAKPTCVDIYCGAGGSTYGAQSAGLRVAYGLDNDPNALGTFVKNHPTAYADCRDVAEVKAREILERGQVDHIDYLLSGPNCQAVSTMGLFWDGDPRNLLFVHLARLIEELIALDKAPQTVLIENVPGIAFKKNIRIVQDLVRFFHDRDYRCAADVVNFATWGLPQLRHRFVLFATRADVQPSLPAPVASTETGEGLVTVWDAISDLAPLRPTAEGESVERVVDGDELTPYQRRLGGQTSRIFNHHEGRTADIDIERIHHVPEGGGWKDIPPDLLPERFLKVRMTDYKTLYGRLAKGHPSYTVYSAYGNVTSGCFTHPDHDRPLTVREGMRLQGFPDDFVVSGSVPSQYRQIGNAVPALAAEILVEHCQALLRGEERDTAPLRLDSQLLFETQPPKLPILTPRYKLFGYGTGTYWPKGWGEEPDERPGADQDYRISKEPIRYRKASWRFRRDARMKESLDSVRHLEWKLLDGTETAAFTPVFLLSARENPKQEMASSEYARRKFMQFIAPAASAIASIRSSKTLVHCDFGITADWLQKFLSLLVEDGQAKLSVVAGDEEERDAGNQPTVLVTTSNVGNQGRDDFDVVVLARPFTSLNGDIEGSIATIEELESPTESIAIKRLDLTAEEVLAEVT